MKLKSGDMLIMEAGSNALRVQVIGRADVPRVESEGRGWRDGATAVLKGADVAEFLDALGNTSGEYGIGDSGLSVKVKYDALPSGGPEVLVLLSAKGVSVRLTWPERTLLMHAIRSLAWRMFM